MKTKNILIVAVVGLSGAVAYLLLRKKPQQPSAMPTISGGQTTNKILSGGQNTNTILSPVNNNNPSQIILDAEKDQFNLLLKKYRQKEKERNAFRTTPMFGRNKSMQRLREARYTKQLREIEQELNDLGYFKKGLTFVKQ